MKRVSGIAPEKRGPHDPQFQFSLAIARSDAVLFDFDFTLADSSAGIITCVNYALSEMGLDESSTAEIIKTVGLYLPEALVVLKGEQYRSRGDEFLRLFTHKADEVMVNGTFFLPGAKKVLKSLNQSGYRLAIVSTKYRFRIETVLDRDGLRDTVEVIVGGEDVTDHKPHPEGLLRAASQLGLPVENCIYVGDSEVDARAAQSAQMPFIAVLTGAASIETFGVYPNRAVLPSVADMLEANADSDKIEMQPAGPL